MHKIAIVIYNNITTEAKSPTFRALQFAEELLSAGDDVTVIFDGGGSVTLAEIIKPDNPLHRAWTKVSPTLRGVCQGCAKAYGVQDALVAANIPMLTDFKGHASLRALLEEGRQIVTF